MEARGNAIGGRVLERKVWARVTQDGLWDIYLGLLFVNIAAWMVAAELDLGYAESVVPVVGFLIVTLGAFQTAKRKLTLARLGHVKLQRSRTRKLDAVAAISVGITVVMVGVTFAFGATDRPAGVSTVPLLFAALALQVVVLFGLAGYYLGVRRFFAYAIASAAGFLAGEWAVASMTDAGRGWDLVGLFGLPALLMLPVGTVLLVRFLRAYPPVENADAADGNVT